MRLVDRDYRALKQPMEPGELRVAETTDGAYVIYENHVYDAEGRTWVMPYLRPGLAGPWPTRYPTRQQAEAALKAL